MAYNPRYKYDKSGKLEGKIESYEDAAARSQIYVMLIKLFARLAGPSETLSQLLILLRATLPLNPQT